MKGILKIFLIILAAALLGLLAILTIANLSSIRPRIVIEQQYIDSLTLMREIAQQKGEYPIGAIIIYQDSILGKGFNTIRHLNDPTGHAEINAIRDVFQRMDQVEFRDLNRDSLIMISSYEPCMMCKGILNYYEIRKIYYLDRKKSRIRLNFLRKDFSYHFKIRRIKVSNDQYKSFSPEILR
jgi:tRNA(Arg) A34 adenosine deaminase TadA